jgi:hypothetical protein
MASQGDHWFKKSRWFKKTETEREAERVRRAERRRDRELKRLGWNSYEEFKADAEEWGRRFPDKRG